MTLSRAESGAIDDGSGLFQWQQVKGRRRRRGITTIAPSPDETEADDEEGDEDRHEDSGNGQEPESSSARTPCPALPLLSRSRTVGPTGESTWELSAIPDGWDIVVERTFISVCHQTERAPRVSSAPARLGDRVIAREQGTDSEACESVHGDDASTRGQQSVDSWHSHPCSDASSSTASSRTPSITTPMLAANGTLVVPQVERAPMAPSTPRAAGQQASREASGPLTSESHAAGAGVASQKSRKAARRARKRAARAAAQASVAMSVADRPLSAAVAAPPATAARARGTLPGTNAIPCVESRRGAFPSGRPQRRCVRTPHQECKKTESSAAQYDTIVRRGGGENFNVLMLDRGGAAACHPPSVAVEPPGPRVSRSASPTICRSGDAGAVVAAAMARAQVARGPPGRHVASGSMGSSRCGLLASGSRGTFVPGSAHGRWRSGPKNVFCVEEALGMWTRHEAPLLKWSSFHAPSRLCGLFAALS